MPTPIYFDINNVKKSAFPLANCEKNVCHKKVHPFDKKKIQFHLLRNSGMFRALPSLLQVYKCLPRKMIRLYTKQKYLSAKFLKGPLGKSISCLLG